MAVLSGKGDGMEELQEQKIPQDAMIFCEELVKIYMADGRKVMALQGLDLTVKRGEMLAIIGKSGSGKSSLLNMIGGLDTPTAGKLFVDGHNMAVLNEKEKIAYRSCKVGFVWQKSARNLLPFLTVLQNVEIPMLYAGKKKRDSRRHAMDLLGAVGMAEHGEKLPLQLSGGQQQRVAIATALANEPKLLLADEPTGAVDTKTSDEIFQLFHRLNRSMGVTILIVTHDRSIAQKVDRTVMISDGKISTETLRKKAEMQMERKQKIGFTDSLCQEEYSVLDKAHRLQLTEDILEQAGIRTNKVKVEVVDGKVILRHE